ncbi:MAG: YheU family protein [Pseudomonadales bacterium]|nr:YheU family protein [Pseudomonadales bacterium]
MLIIPHQQLSSAALEALLQEIVTRDGTDYGSTELSVQQKVEQIKSGLISQQMYIVFEPDSETCSIIDKATAESYKLLA